MRERSSFLDQRESKLTDKEQELDARQKDLEPREVTVEKKEKELAELEGGLRALENDLNTARISIENRDRELSGREQDALKFSERSALYETEIKEATQNLGALEEKILMEQKELLRIMTEVTTRREEMLAKMKVLSEQETLLAESKRLVMEEQRRFVDWERGLNDREAALGERERALARREGSPLASSVARPAAEPKPRHVHEEKRPEPKTVGEEPKHHAPKHEPAMAEAPSAKEEPKPEVVVESEESGFSEAFCPECRTIVSASADTCYACGADLKNPRPAVPAKPAVEAKPKEKEAPKEEKPAEEPAAPVAESKSEEHTEVKKSVSIRKIIKRK